MKICQWSKTIPPSIRNKLHNYFQQTSKKSQTLEMHISSNCNYLSCFQLVDWYWEPAFPGCDVRKTKSTALQKTLWICVFKKEAQVSSLCIQVKYNVWPKPFGPTCLPLFMSKHIINQHIACVLMKTLNTLLTQNHPPPWITKVRESL